MANIVLMHLIRFALLALIAGPAFGGTGSIAIPEPGDAALFMLAVAGLLIGRSASKRPPKSDE